MAFDAPRTRGKMSRPWGPWTDAGWVRGGFGGPDRGRRGLLPCPSRVRPPFVGVDATGPVVPGGSARPAAAECVPARARASVRRGRTFCMPGVTPGTQDAAGGSA